MQSNCFRRTALYVKNKLRYFLVEKQNSWNSFNFIVFFLTLIKCQFKIVFKTGLLEEEEEKQQTISHSFDPKRLL